LGIFEDNILNFVGHIVEDIDVDTVVGHIVVGIAGGTVVDIVGDTVVDVLVEDIVGIVGTVDTVGRRDTEYIVEEERGIVDLSNIVC